MTIHDDNKYKPLKDKEGDPIYSDKDDIYSQQQKEDVSPEDMGVDNDENIEIDPDDDTQWGLDEGLDVPGAELDNEDELIGEEDEENNYYSLGGESHDDLEEDEDD